MTYIENIFLCMVSPLLVAALCMGRRQLRFFLFCIAGMGVCLLSAYINTFLAAVCQADALAATAEIAPVVEEMMKLLPLVFYLLVFEPESERIKPAAITVTLSFATFENVCYLIQNGADRFSFIFFRGFGTGAMHVLCGLIVGGGLNSLALRLKHQKIEHQRQQLHHFLHHRRNLRRGGKGVRLTHRREEGVDIGRKQAHPHPGNAEQEEAELPPAHAQSGHQQGRYHAEEDVFDVGHASTALLVAGSSPRMANVSSISHQKVGLAGEVSGQKQPAVQSRYSETAKHSTPM